jgi:hypothetical protein
MALAQPVGRLGHPAGSECALVQALDRDRIVHSFGQDGEGQIAHG